MKREFSSSLQWDSFWNATTEFTSTSAHSYSRKRFEPCFTKNSVLKVHWTRVITGLTPWKKALQGICLSPSFHCSRSKVPSPPFWKQGDGIPVFILELFFFSLSYIGLPVSIFGVDQDNRSVGIYRLWTEFLQCQEFAIGSHLNIEQKKKPPLHRYRVLFTVISISRRRFIFTVFKFRENFAAQIPKFNKPRTKTGRLQQ